MRGGTHASSPIDPETWAAQAADTASRDEHDLAELYKETLGASSQAELTLQHLVQADRHQQGATAEALAAAPLPPDFPSDYRIWFTHNTSLYDDEMEAILDADPVLVALGSQAVSEANMAALRARRSIVVLSLITLQAAAHTPPAISMGKVA